MPVTSPAAVRPLGISGSAGGGPRIEGKFIYNGAEKLYLRGVTYGPFEPDMSGSEYHTPEAVAADFARMRACGVNTVRTYTVPPRWLLDAAEEYGLYVLVGLPWEQHVTFLEERGRKRSIEAQVRAGAQACAGHPALLGYAVGNEIPASLVRWYGPRRIARFIQRLYRAVKEEAPGALVTYVNFPTTEYLQHYLSFLDFACFNVYLESQGAFEAYLARLQNLSGNRPLVMAEIGLDSCRNGLAHQAHTLDWQIRSTFAAGCAGVFVFSWTDEWYRGGASIDDWDFGLTDRRRCPKPALEAVSRAFAEIPFPSGRRQPRFSVVVCTHNGARTLAECLQAVERLAYRDYEVIVVDDGSTDATASIARNFNVRLIQTANRGLSAARNTGMKAADGEIIAYLDDDAYPDPHWLSYLAHTFMTTDHVAVGGPNIAPGGDGLVAEAVNHAPGNPMHVLFSDREAEHLPGCNFAVRKEALLAIGGFDTQFRIAGDDVDACWRLQEYGWTLGYHPAAMVWHHRRRSVRTFWSQQFNYGKAEALLEMKWPEKYNQLGHQRWQGRVYNGGLSHFSAFRRWRIYYGRWGSNLFQSLRDPVPNITESLPLMPEWYLLIAALSLLSVTGLFWPPLLWSVLLLGAAVGMLVVQTGRSVTRISGHDAQEGSLGRVRLLTGFLHLAQPLARLLGRLRRGLSPWRILGTASFLLPRPRRAQCWSERWQPAETWMGLLEAGLYAQRTIVRHGGDFDRWDLEVRGGLFGAARLLLVIEEHGNGKQLVRLRFWPLFSVVTHLLVNVFGVLAIAAALSLALEALVLLGLIALGALLRGLRDCAAAQAAIHRAVGYLSRSPSIATLAAPAADSRPEHILEWTRIVDLLHDVDLPTAKAAGRS